MVSVALSVQPSGLVKTVLPDFISTTFVPFVLYIFLQTAKGTFVIVSSMASTLSELTLITELPCVLSENPAKDKALPLIRWLANVINRILTAFINSFDRCLFMATVYPAIPATDVARHTKTPAKQGFCVRLLFSADAGEVG